MPPENITPPVPPKVGRGIQIYHKIPKIPPKSEEDKEKKSNRGIADLCFKRVCKQLFKNLNKQFKWFFFLNKVFPDIKKNSWTTDLHHGDQATLAQC